VRYTGPLTAPVAAGTQVGELVVTIPDLPENRIPLFTESAVAKGGFVQRVSKAATMLIGRLSADAEPAS
jgi:serine-type D-Ala-D-Ala carboxypeptidase (penicillin-binding protein 5/6)